MIGILIADDHPIVRSGLRQIICEEPDMEVLSEAADAVEVFEKLRAHSFTIAVLDITMPGRSGLDTLRQIRAEFPSVPVLILSVHPEDQYAVRAIRAGASGYLTKSSAPAELVTAIRRIVGGKKYISYEVGEALAERLFDGERALHQALSDREFEIMVMLASGRTVTEIAKDLYISAKTVSTHRSRILDKMKMKTNADLTRYALEKHLL